MIGYILISYGPRPTGSLRQCKAAWQQIRNFVNFAQKVPDKTKLQFFHDYTRTITSLSSLPILKDLLVLAKERNAVIITDSYQRLFVKCPPKYRRLLFKELIEYSDNFRDLQFGRSLAELSRFDRTRILTTQSPFKFVLGQTPKSTLSAEDRYDQTRKATKASQLARSAAADRKAEELNKLKEELETNVGSVSFSELARAANERGLRTTRNQEWSSTTAKRALDRLKSNAD